MHIPIMAIFRSVFLLVLIIAACQDANVITMDIRSISDIKQTNRCQDGIVCREDSDCFDGRCNQGVCNCKSADICHNDNDCGQDQCCNVMNGLCYECVKDIQSDYEDLLSEDVIDNVNDVSDDIQDVIKVECESDLLCTVENPYCHPQKRICVECYENSHCRSGKCDIDNGYCKNLSVDSGMDVTGDDLFDVLFDTGEDILQDAGDPCLDYVCLCGTICVVESGNPTCKNGCNTDKDCCSNTVCSNGRCEKNICTEDIDCKDPLRPHCEIISGLCYECTNDIHCQADYYCDSNYICKFKVDACYGQCKSNQWCNPSTGICEDIPSNWCSVCSQVLDPLCIVDGLTCGLTTKRCTKQCTDDNECYGYTCNLFGWCTCP